MLTLEAGNAVSAAAVIVERTPKTLSETARRIYQALCGAALEVSKERGYHPSTTHITLFCPAEAVALAVGIHPATLYRMLPQLTAEGLIAVRGHYCTHKGKTRSDGSLWAIRLTPNHGSKARIGYDYLKKSYRCLGDDISSNRTAWNQMRESKSIQREKSIDINQILPWALSTDSKEPVTVDSRIIRRFDLESIFDLPHVRKQDRAESVYNAARGLAVSLGDSHSTLYYARVLWALLKLRDRGEGDFFGQLYDLVARCRADRAEGFARGGNAGALFVSRVRMTSWWSEIWHAPPVRVSLRPT